MTRYWWFPCTTAAALVTAAGAVAIAATGTDLIHIEFFAQETRPVHKWDELVLALILVASGFAADRSLAVLRLRRAAEREAERLRVLRATMRTVQDITNNFLGGVQWVVVTSEDVLEPETLDLLNALIADTAAKLKALGDLERVDEREMALGSCIAFHFAGADPRGQLSAGRTPSAGGAPIKPASRPYRT